MYDLSPRTAGGSVQPPTASARLCFIVDDDAGICLAMAFTVRKLGFEACELASAAALDAALRERMPSIVFLDLGLGQSGALDTLPILARHGYRGPVQLMSGRSQSVLDEVVAAGEREGLTMLPALMKPFRMGIVKELIARLDGARGEGGSTT